MTKSGSRTIRVDEEVYRYILTKKHTLEDECQGFVSFTEAVWQMIREFESNGIEDR